MYCAIIGDLVDSRKLNATERNQLQIKLNALLTQINTQLQPQIAAKFVITLGDEFQGLLHVPGATPVILEHIIKSLSPQLVRIGVGFGDIYTEIQPEQALGADGPAYHLAREAIQALKTSWNGVTPGFSVRFCTGNPDEELLNALSSAIDTLMSSWTNKQRTTIWQTIDCNDHQQEAARLLGLNPSTVTRQLQSAKYTLYKQWMGSLSHYLQRQYQKEASCS